MDNMTLHNIWYDPGDTYKKDLKELKALNIKINHKFVTLKDL